MKPYEAAATLLEFDINEIQRVIEKTVEYPALQVEHVSEKQIELEFNTILTCIHTPRSESAEGLLTKVLKISIEGHSFLDVWKQFKERFEFIAPTTKYSTAEILFGSRAALPFLGSLEAC